MVLPSSVASSEFATTLEYAAASFRNEIRDVNRPTAEAVVNALLQAEKVAKQQRLTYPFEALLGQWRLCFVTGTRKAKQRAGIVLGKGFYVPKIAPAYISFIQNNLSLENQSEIANQIQFGFLKLRLTGLARYLKQKNLLAFDFTQMQIFLFDRAIYTGEIRGGQAKAEEFYQ